MKTRAKQVVIDIVCPCSHLSLYTDCSLTSTLVLFLPAELQGRDEMSLTIREEVASLKQKVAGLEVVPSIMTKETSVRCFTVCSGSTIAFI